MDKQEKMFSKFEQPGNTTESVEQYEFEPIQGYPMLHWKGKRPFRSTQYYPAQLKETYGEPVDGWINRIYWGDNLQVMSHLLKEFRGKISLIYLDPPFDSKAEYKKIVKLKGKSIENGHNVFEEKQYTDIWTNDEYLQFMYERLIISRELLSDNGSIYLHCDYRKVHHLRCLLDEIFGPEKFVNEIVWKSTTFTGSSKTIANKYPVNHNIILWYCKNDYIFNKQRLPYSDEYLKRFTNPDNDPKGPWQSVSLKTYSEETFNRLKDNGMLIAPQKEGAGWRYKFYLKDAKGRVVETIWDNINMANSMSKDRTGYPTQKPLELLERVISGSSNPNDIVLDCFMGSGTTQAAAMKLGRRFIGADINIGAIQISTKRLLALSDEINEQSSQIKVDEASTYYTSFSVYNVNYYDIFRNPVQAKDLLIEALEIQPIPYNTVYDGEKDGRMVKIMPVNRIATRADLNELISNFDYKKFEKRKSEQPNKAVEKILLVCMGHEPDLAGVLEKEAGYKLDVEVVDILRDKSNLEFKRDSEAVVITKNENIEIQNFYPMNLLQKLSLMKENVEDWRELVESVMIDWDYDGETLRPAMTDIPGKNELVKGTYSLPERHGNIRIKITDLLSESWEGGVANG